MNEAQQKRNRILRFKKTRAAAVLCAVMGLVSCRTHPPVDSWGDAGLVAEQRERIGELERAIQNGTGHIRAAEEELGNLESGNIGFEIWLRAVDAFVRTVIEERRKLESVQQPDSREDAGEG